MNQLYENQEKAKALREEIEAYEAKYAKEAEKNKNRVEFVRELQYKKGERIFAEQYRGIHKCGKDGDLSGLRYYLEKAKLNINEQDVQGDTTLHHAAARGHLETLKWLIEEAAEAIVGEPAPPPLPDDATPDEVAGDPLAEIRAEHARLRADLGRRNRFGRTALHAAAQHGRAGCAAYLLARGADPRAPDAQGMTPAHWAAAGDRPDVLRALHAAQDLPRTPENVGAPSGRGITPAHSAANANSLRALQFLAEAGVDLNAQDMNGDTPAHYAARMNWSETIDVLKDNGADMFIMNSDDDTPEDLISDTIRHTLLFGEREDGHHHNNEETW